MLRESGDPFSPIFLPLPQVPGSPIVSLTAVATGIRRSPISKRRTSALVARYVF